MKLKSKISSMNLTLGKIYAGNIILNTDGKLMIAVYNDAGLVQMYFPMHFEPVIN